MLIALGSAYLAGTFCTGNRAVLEFFSLFKMIRWRAGKLEGNNNPSLVKVKVLSARALEIFFTNQQIAVRSLSS